MNSREKGPRADYPVTVVLTRRVRPESAAEFARKLAEHLGEVHRLPGHLGVEVLRPPSDASTWTFVFRFATQEHLDEWASSGVREGWERTVAPLTIGQAHVQSATGLETWFTMDGLGVVSPPPKWKMAVATWLAIYPTITGLLLLIGQPLASIVLPARTLILTGVLVPLMTYGLMPLATRALRRWLYGEAGA